MPANVQTARVVVVQYPGATEAFEARLEPAKEMVSRGIQSLAQTNTSKDAWLRFVSLTNVIGIKVHSLPGALSGTRKVVVESVIDGLTEAGVAPTNIVIIDKHSYDLRLAGFYELARRKGVRVASCSDVDFDPDVFYESPLIGNLLYGDSEFGKTITPFEGLGRKSYVSKLLTKEVGQVISISPLLNHNVAGVAGHLYGMTIGMSDNTGRFESDISRMDQAVPEIYALPAIADKVVLNITDALLCQYQGSERTLLHYSTAMNELWFSKDPVSLDTLAVAEIAHQREEFLPPMKRAERKLYSNAALLELGQNDTNKIRIEQISLPLK